MVKRLGRIGVVGPGAIGGFYGGMLAQSGEDVHFLFRSTFDDIVRGGLTLFHHREGGSSAKVENLHAYDSPSSLGPCDWIIVAVKATANSALEEMIRPMLGPSTRLLTLQNGMGNVENLHRLFGEDRQVMAGLCFTCINRTSPNVIESLLPGYVQKPWSNLLKILELRFGEQILWTMPFGENFAGISPLMDLPLLPVE
jgi:2-dehydropantoate 2-reductase